MLSNSGTKPPTGTVRLEPIPTKRNEKIPSPPGIDIVGRDLIVSHPKTGRGSGSPDGRRAGT